MKVFTFDYETTSTNFLDAKMVLFAYKIDDEPIKVSKDINDIRQYLESPNCLKIAHNMLFEYSVSKTLGIVVKEPFYCTQVACWLLNKAVKVRKDEKGKDVCSYALKPLAEKYLGYEHSPDFKELSKQHMQEYLTGKLLKGGIEQIKKRPALASEIPVEILSEYCKKDVEMTYKLYKLTEPLLKTKSLDKLFKMEMDLIPVFSDMERRGILINKDYLEKQGKLLTDEMTNIEKEMKQWV